MSKNLARHWERSHVDQGFQVEDREECPFESCGAVFRCGEFKLVTVSKRIHMERHLKNGDGKAYLKCPACPGRYFYCESDLWKHQELAHEDGVGRGAAGRASLWPLDDEATEETPARGRSYWVPYCPVRVVQRRRSPVAPPIPARCSSPVDMVSSAKRRRRRDECDDPVDYPPDFIDPAICEPVRPAKRRYGRFTLASVREAANRMYPGPVPLSLIT